MAYIREGAKILPMTFKKYTDLQKRFDELYNTKRLRLDDCIDQLRNEFYIELAESVMSIINLDLSKVEVREKKKKKALQQ